MSGINVIKEPTTKKTIETKVARDKRLSFKARGIMFYLLSKPDDWVCQLYDLEKNSDADGRKAIQAAMKELVEFGYAKFCAYKKNDDGLMGSFYEVYDVSKKPDYVKTITRKQRLKDNYLTRKNQPPC